MSYVTLDELREHLKIENNDSDLVLTIYLDTATSVLESLITDDVNNDTTGKMAKALKNATLILAGWYEDERNGSTNSYVIDPIYGLPTSVVSIVKLFRTPTAV
ncbi:hypothetical protein MOXK02_17940 [Moraxella sp. K02]